MRNSYLAKIYQNIILEKQDDHAPSKVEKAFTAFLKNLPDQDFLAIASLDAEQMKQLLFACVKKIDKTRAKEIEKKTAEMSNYKEVPSGKPTPPREMVPVEDE